MLSNWIMTNYHEVDYFVKNGGSLDAVIANAEHSVEEKNVSSRDYTYSEFGKLMEELTKYNK